MLWNLALIAQDCDCDLTLEGLNQNQLNFVFGETLELEEGDTICIPSGQYAGIRFYDIIGSSEDYITIVNCGGPVIIEESVQTAISFQRSQYIQFKGIPTEDSSYGFNVKSTNIGAQGVEITNLSSDIIIDNIEVSGSGFAGIMAKTDPDCSRPETLRDGGFVMRNIIIKNNYVHHTHGEGIYVGYTGTRLHATNYFCDGVPIFAHWNENITVENNLFENIGLDAIQLNLVTQNGIVRNNTIKDYAIRQEAFQDYAMSIGTGRYDIYNNKVTNVTDYQGRGLQLLSAFSGSKIFNNLIVNPKQQGVFIHMRDPFGSNEGYLIANNTIVNPQNAGILYNTKIIEYENEEDYLRDQDEVQTKFINNLIIGPLHDYRHSNTWKGRAENFIDFNSVSTRNAIRSHIVGNIFSEDIDELHLMMTSNSFYAPQSMTSSLVDVGEDLTGYGITFDIENNPRPMGQGYDVGAFELLVAEEEPAEDGEMNGGDGDEHQNDEDDGAVDQEDGESTEGGNEENSENEEDEYAEGTDDSSDESSEDNSSESDGTHADSEENGSDGPDDSESNDDSEEDSNNEGEDVNDEVTDDANNESSEDNSTDENDEESAGSEEEGNHEQSEGETHHDEEGNDDFDDESSEGTSDENEEEHSDSEENGEPDSGESETTDENQGNSEGAEDEGNEETNGEDTNEEGSQDGTSNEDTGDDGDEGSASNSDENTGEDEATNEDDDDAESASENTSNGNEDVEENEQNDSGQQNITNGEGQGKTNIEVILSPNPATDQIRIHYEGFSKAHIQIFNESGVLVKQQPLQPLNEVLDVSSLNAGVHYLRLILPNQTEHLKRIVIL